MAVDLHADFLIIGSGIAGLRAAVELAGAGSVLILTKAEPREGNTGYAQGGIAAAVGPGDSPALHAADTIAAGDGLCDPHAVEVLVDEGPGYVRELMAWGAAFDREPDGTPALAIEGAHSARRVLHARDATGREIGRTLWRRASALAGVSNLGSRARRRARDRRRTAAAGNLRCIGARILHEDGTTSVAHAGVGTARDRRCRSCLQRYDQSTGGHGRRRGDGVSRRRRRLRSRVRAVPPDGVEGTRASRGSCCRRRCAARALDCSTGAVRPSCCATIRPAISRLATASRAASSSKRGGPARPVYLSLEHLDPDFVHERFPLISGACRQAGLDLARDRIPVGPAAHYVMGGVQTDLDGQTTIDGLFAAGEVACTGVHGANRLASNSLLEGLVFGARAGRAMRSTGVRAASGSAGSSGSGVGARCGRTWTPRIFRGGCGVTWVCSATASGWHRRWRTSSRPGRAIDGWLRDGGTLDADGWRAASLLTVGRLIARAALRREESRGAHYRDDYPARDDIHWKRRVSDRL